MHEVGLMQNVLRIALDHASQKKAQKIVRIKIRVGELQGIVSDSLDFIFSVISKGTLAEGAKIEIESVSTLCQCLQCNQTFHPKDYLVECPHCHQTNIEIRQGREFELASIETS